jgi:cyclic pyranopterin monophosphate synthase
MVDVSAKPETAREAVARATIKMKPATLRAVRRGDAPKGDVLGTARTAGILAAKRTSELIPLCHPLRLTKVDVTFDERRGNGTLAVEARVRTVDKTGVEMEALTAVTVAALTIYDMVKALDRAMVIGEIRLVEKRGGRSGNYERDGQPVPPKAESKAEPASPKRRRREGGRKVRTPKGSAPGNARAG